MKIEKEHVSEIAQLARLHLNDEEVATYQHQLAAIIQYMEQLHKVDIEGISPLAHPAQLINQFRSDVKKPFPLPEQANNFFVVPKVLEAS